MQCTRQARWKVDHFKTLFHGKTEKLSPISKDTQESYQCGTHVSIPILEISPA